MSVHQSIDSNNYEFVASLMFSITDENGFAAALIDDSNSNMSFPSPAAPISEDSQDTVTELQAKKDDDQLLKPIAG